MDSNALNNGSYAPAINTDPTGYQSNVPFAGNDDIIAMDSEGALFLDGDGTLSFYNQLNGNLAQDGTWTQLSGASADATLSGSFLNRALIQNDFIGAEDNHLAFLIGDDRVEYYRRDTGAFLRVTDYSTATDGPLGTYTLAEIVDGNAGDFRFIGMDVGPMIVGGLIPEPSSVLLLTAGAGGLLFRRRRA